MARDATVRPMRPSPTTPNVLPANCVPWYWLRFFHSSWPERGLWLAAGILRGRGIIRATACSAVDSVEASAVLRTRMPLEVAASRSMLSTPTPARAIALSLPGLARTFAVALTPERTTIASYCPIVPASSSSFRPIFVSNSIPDCFRKSRPSSASLSATSMRIAAKSFGQRKAADGRGRPLPQQAALVAAPRGQLNPYLQCPAMAKNWQYGRLRAIALQVVMWLIFGASLGLAAYIDHRKSVQLDVRLGEPRPLGRLTVRLPQGWEVEDDAGPPQALVAKDFDRQGRQRRTLRITQEQQTGRTRGA